MPKLLTGVHLKDSLLLLVAIAAALVSRMAVLFGLLPLLSAFLGHVHVADTQWYLSGSPELMREAMRRLEHRWRKPS